MQEVGRRTDAQQRSLAILQELKADRSELLAAQEDFERKRQADKDEMAQKKEEQKEEYKVASSHNLFFLCTYFSLMCEFYS